MVQAGSTHGTSVKWSGHLLARGLDHKHFGDGCNVTQKNQLTSGTAMAVRYVERALQLVVCVFFE